MIQTFKTLKSKVSETVLIFLALSWKSKFVPSLCSTASFCSQQHLLSVSLHMHSQEACKQEVYRPAGARHSRRAHQMQNWACVHASVCLHMCMGVRGGVCFLIEFANRFRLSKSVHTCIWKLYFLTWAIFWKIDSDVWNWFRTVVRNVQYKWKKLVFNVFSSQVFLLSKYAFWGVRELVGEVWRGSVECRRLFPRT